MGNKRNRDWTYTRKEVCTWTYRLLQGSVPWYHATHPPQLAKSRIGRLMGHCVTIYIYIHAISQIPCVSTCLPQKSQATYNGAIASLIIPILWIFFLVWSLFDVRPVSHIHTAEGYRFSAKCIQYARHLHHLSIPHTLLPSLIFTPSQCQAATFCHGGCGRYATCSCKASPCRGYAWHAALLGTCLPSLAIQE